MLKMLVFNGLPKFQAEFFTSNSGISAMMAGQCLQRVGAAG